jgi:hypothetical protein
MPWNVFFHRNWPYVNGEFFTQAERNSFRPSFKTIRWDLVWPSTFNTRTPLKLKSNDNHSPLQNKFIHKKQKTMQIFLVNYLQHNQKDNVISYRPSFVEPNVDPTRNMRALLMFETEPRSLDSKGTTKV